jgi:hypothetical protein
VNDSSDASVAVGGEVGDIIFSLFTSSFARSKIIMIFVKEREHDAG